MHFKTQRLLRHQAEFICGSLKDLLAEVNRGYERMECPTVLARSRHQRIYPNCGPSELPTSISELGTGNTMSDFVALWTNWQMLPIVWGREWQQASLSDGPQIGHGVGPRSAMRPVAESLRLRKPNFMTSPQRRIHIVWHISLLELYISSLSLGKVSHSKESDSPLHGIQHLRHNKNERQTPEICCLDGDACFFGTRITDRPRRY